MASPARRECEIILTSVKPTVGPASLMMELPYMVWGIFTLLTIFH